ncbi:MAG: 6-phosphofructokinase [Gammaproteobacteria bacterium]|nr:6-phosphofructokinase [Gammaproteobacteria bacterium]
MSKKNGFYAQSGGCTAVINATACGVIETARKQNNKMGRIYAGLNGILGALNEELIDTTEESAATIAALKYTPGSIFGSCRYKLKNFEESDQAYRRLVDVFKAHDIGYLFYNGGGDSQDTIHKISQACRILDFPVTCIGVPKTIDNDIAYTDNCPGFGSSAKFIATTTRECGLDICSMSATSTKVFIYEVMGRHTGWLAAASGLATEKEGEAPHIILVPEVAFDEKRFLAEVKRVVTEHGYCVIVASEGIRDQHGKFLIDHGYQDAFGHTQLGGAAAVLAHLVNHHLGYKYHWAVLDYVQRAARHIASAVDVDQAYAVGKAAVEFALAGKDGVMPVIVRESDEPYKWSISEASLDDIANVEKKLPFDFISEDGFHITQQCRQYLAPLIEGESYPPYRNGLPEYAKLKQVMAAKTLPGYLID